MFGEHDFSWSLSDEEFDDVLVGEEVCALDCVVRVKVK